MRISDWSADVCSSDLLAATIVRSTQQNGAVFVEQRRVDLRLGAADQRRRAHLLAVQADVGDRSVVIGEVHLRAEPEVQRMLGVEFDALRHRRRAVRLRSEEHTSELQSLMRISYAVFCLKKKNTDTS